MTRREWIATAVVAATRPTKSEELLLDAATGRTLQSSLPTQPQPCGSLVKPFTALAYPHAEFPTLVCQGQRSGCWSIPGHGRIGLPSAIAFSCNAYFQTLADAVTPQQLALVASGYRIEPPSDDAPGTRIGLGGSWTISPEKLATAYLELVRRRHEPRMALIVEGLRLCSTSGTAKACGPGVLAKTGTSVCAHSRPSPGDGWAIGIFPDDAPRYAMLIRQDGVPGAKASELLANRIRQQTRGSWRQQRS